MSVQIRRLATTQDDFEAQLQQLLHWSADTDQAIEQRVAEIMADVRARGDEALLEATRRFDGLDAARVAELEIPPADCRAALESLPAAQRQALEAAAPAYLSPSGPRERYPQLRWRARR